MPQTGFSGRRSSIYMMLYVLLVAVCLGSLIRAGDFSLGRMPWTLIHQDFRVDNLFFDDLGANGEIDFETAFALTRSVGDAFLGAYTKRPIVYGVLLWREGAFRFLPGPAVGEDIQIDLDLDRNPFDSDQRGGGNGRWHAAYARSARVSPV